MSHTGSKRATEALWYLMCGHADTPGPKYCSTTEALETATIQFLSPASLHKVTVPTCFVDHGSYCLDDRLFLLW